MLLFIIEAMVRYYYAISNDYLQNIVRADKVISY